MLKSAMISSNKVSSTEIIVLRQFITALFAARNRSENPDAFMERFEKEPIIHELRVLASGLKVPIRSQGDSEVRRLFERLKEGS